MKKTKTINLRIGSAKRTEIDKFLEDTYVNAHKRTCYYADSGYEEKVVDIHYLFQEITTANKIGKTFAWEGNLLTTTENGCNIRFKFNPEKGIHQYDGLEMAFTMMWNKEEEKYDLKVWPLPWNGMYRLQRVDSNYMVNVICRIYAYSEAYRKFGKETMSQYFYGFDDLI